MINCTIYHNVNDFQHINQYEYVPVIYYKCFKKSKCLICNMQAIIGIVVNIKAISTGSAKVPVVPGLYIPVWHLFNITVVLKNND